jgi:CelD/BcsL family acetyltransferase involved in cellulose biosynthesis
VLTDLVGAERLRPEWRALYSASGTTNVFLHPAWVLTWARHFVAPGDLFIVVARAGARLVGVAPFYRQRLGLAVGPSATRLRLLGAGVRTELSELPGILACSDRTRAFLRGMFGALAESADEWDWVEVSMGCEQGWFEPQWLDRDGRPPAGSVVHKGTKPCVVMPLAASWPLTESGLKRNVRKSIRRGYDRMTRAGRKSEFVVVEPPDLEAWVRTVARMHAARATMVGKVRHPDLLADQRTQAFLIDVGRSLIGEGTFLPCLLRVDNEDVAARLVLHGAGRLYFSFSGFDPRFWAEGVATVLMAECLRWGTDNGCTSANLSVGIDMAKLRWAELLELNQDFLLVGTRRRSRAAFSLYWQLRAATVLRRPDLVQKKFRENLWPG